ncbi:MAG: translocation protein TolB [Bacteroidetes bacterium]|nr:translocation protein TolB [Bacteroidota bacterium]
MPCLFAMKLIPKISAWVIVLSFLTGEIGAQFYNGHQMSFGKNRVQYNDYVWSFYRYEGFDVYFNEDGTKLAEYVSDYAAEILPRIESFFDYTLDKRIIFMVYNRLSDFRESNIGLVTGNEEYNIGGVTNISRNKVFLYYEGDLNKFDIQIKAAIASVLMNEMLYGNLLRENITNSTLNNIPGWYFDGLVSYLSNRWDFQIENKLKDGIANGKYEKFNRLTGEDATIVGHSFWKFIADTYGESVIPSILYITRINKSSKAGFSYVLGMSLKELSYEWMGYYLNLFASDEKSKKTPDTGALMKKTKRGVVYQNLKISPSGNYIAYVTNKMGQYKIWLQNVETGKKERILKRGQKLEQIVDYSCPVLAWHPSGRILSFITEENGGLKLYYYILADKQKVVKNMLYFEKVLDYSFSDDGLLLVISGVIKGQTDIFIHNLAASTNEQITHDPADDLSPRFINNSSQIIFSSDRLSDTLSDGSSGQKRALTNDLFIYDRTSNKPVLMRLEDGKFVNKYNPVEVSQNHFIQLNDQTGIVNRYLSKFDSAISFVDTTVHYRYSATTKPLTDYGRNILEQDYNKTTGSVGEIFFNKGRYSLFLNPLDLDNASLPEKQEITDTRQQITKKLALEDSLRNLNQKVISIESISDNGIIIDEDTVKIGTGEIDVNKYVFEAEKINLYNEKLRGKNAVIRVDTAKPSRPGIRIYETAFYQNYLVSQIDFNFLNASYQAFTGGAFYFNPGFNVLFKLGTNDLFEDYKITGGIRLSPDFDANEYLVSFENLRKRLDKSIIFHQQAFKNTGISGDIPFIVKTHTYELSYVMRYPFNQVQSLVTTVNMRTDRSVYLSTGPYTLNQPDELKLWGGLKFEFIHDNTRHLGLNLYSGLRYKLFAEFYEQFYENYNELIVFGADVRHYTRLHRSLIWANRVAWSSSQGSTRIIYYLGGVDNWINFTQNKYPTFIPFSEISIDPDQNYAYQAVGTNMRGFSQNIRNGNNFAVFNSELRFPVIKYIANYPLSNNFLENLQLVGFFDVGTAWSGKTPFSGENAYDNDIIENGPITITIDADRFPIVAGYGLGVRSQLLGYFLRLDWAWGIENNQWLPRIFYFSMGLDF